MADRAAPPRIRCAICDKPVEGVEWFETLDPPGRVIRAFCHGEKDEMTLLDVDIARMHPEEIKALASSEGVAFAKSSKRLHQMSPSEARRVFDVLDRGRND